NKPASAAHISPIQGLPTFTVTAAAVNAPASIMPSRAMLMTPPRSHNIPPNEASVSGVAYLIIDARSERVRIVLSIILQVSSFWFLVCGYRSDKKSKPLNHKTRNQNQKLETRNQKPK